MKTPKQLRDEDQNSLVAENSFWRDGLGNVFKVVATSFDVDTEERLVTYRPTGQASHDVLREGGSPMTAFTRKADDFLASFVQVRQFTSFMTEEEMQGACT